MYKYSKFIIFILILLYGCSKKDTDVLQLNGKSLPTPTNTSSSFDFTASIIALTDSSATLHLSITGKKNSDILQYSLRLNNQMIGDQLKDTIYTIHHLAAEKDYELVIDLKDQLNNAKSRNLTFTTSKYYTKFNKSYLVYPNVFGDKIIQTSDKGFLISGFAPGRNGNDSSIEGITLLKLNEKGNQVWASKFEYDNRFSLGYGTHCVAETTDGGYLVNGSSCIIKVDANGNKVWVKYFDRTGFNLLIEGFSLNKDHTIIVCGYGEAGALVYKLSADGQLLWQNSFYYNESTSIDTRSIVETADNGYMILGRNYDNDFKIFYAKLDALGNVIWKKTFLQTGFNNADKLKASPDGSFTIIGHRDAVTPITRLVRVSIDGNVLLDVTLDRAGYISPYDFDFTPDGYVIAGTRFPSQGSSVFFDLIKTDNLGNITWQKEYANQFCRGVSYTADQGFVATGGNSNILVFKLDPNGRY